MGRARVLISEPLPHMEEDIQTLSAYADVTVAPSPTEEALCAEIGEADLLLVVYAKVTSRVIEAAPKLRGIVRCGIGVDNIDLGAATARKIIVVNVPDYATETVSDHAFALLISLARRITLADHAMRNKSWGTWTSPSKRYRGIDLEGRTLGIIGIGRIGRALARKAHAFNMNLLAFDPYVEEKELDGTKVKLTDLDTLLKESDFVAVNAALPPQTRGLIGEKQLRLMKHSAYIINTSRGSLIDENALIRALEEKWIAGAGLDVYENEPPDIHNPLLGFENTVLTPHIAWATEEATRRLERAAVERATELLQGKIPRTVVNLEVLK